MRGPSERSREAVVDRVVEAVASGAEAAVLGEQLFTLCRTLDDQAGLRRMLTDPSVEADRRAGVVEGLLHAFDDATVTVAALAVRQRWSATRDLADALERGGATAFLLAAENAGDLDEVEDELFRFARIVEAQPALRAALGDRASPLTARRQLVETLLADRVGEPTLRLVQHAVTGRHRSVPAALVEMQRLAAARRERLVAVVRVARPLTAALRRRLEAALAEMFDHEVQLNVIVDPDVLGGVRVVVGDDVVDGTVATRLAEARRLLAG